MWTYDPWGFHDDLGQVLQRVPIARGMVTGRIRLTGVDEGIECTVSTRLCGADSPSKVAAALQNLFPDAAWPEGLQEPNFGTTHDLELQWKGQGMKTFLEAIHQQRILDTALDAMSRNLKSDATTFSLARQAAAAGKVAFPIPDEHPVGGSFRLDLSGRGLSEWLEAATWHPGRTQVPRSVGDERSMAENGEASTWH